MILDEIQKAYFRNNLMDEIGVVLEISQETYHDMAKEDERLLQLTSLSDKGELPPMFGRPVNVVVDGDFTWRWVKHG